MNLKDYYTNDLLELLELFQDKHWDYKWLSQNPNINWEIVRDNQDKPWSYACLSRNPNITWEIVRDNPDKPWRYDMLSSNPNITWEIVRDNPDKPWSYASLSTNRFKKHPYYKPKLPVVSKERKELINELYTKWGIPPNVDTTKPIFSKGGIHFWETWKMIECL